MINWQPCFTHAIVSTTTAKKLWEFDSILISWVNKSVIEKN